MSYSDLQYRDAEQPDPEWDEWSDQLTYQAQQQQEEDMRREEETARPNKRGVVSGLGEARSVLENTGAGGTRK